MVCISLTQHYHYNTEKSACKDVFCTISQNSATWTKMNCWFLTICQLQRREKCAILKTQKRRYSPMYNWSCNAFPGKASHPFEQKKYGSKRRWTRLIGWGFRCKFKQIAGLHPQNCRKRGLEKMLEPKTESKWPLTVCVNHGQGSFLFFIEPWSYKVIGAKAALGLWAIWGIRLQNNRKVPIHWLVPMDRCFLSFKHSLHRKAFKHF